MWELDCEESWAPKNWCFWTVGLEKTLESPWNSREIKPVNPKGNQPWIVIGTIDADAEAPIHWPPDVKSQVIGKDPDAGKDWGQEEKGTTEDEMVGWHHQLNGHEFWASSGRWWRTGKPGVLQRMGSQRGGHDWATEQQQLGERSQFEKSAFCMIPAMTFWNRQNYGASKKINGCQGLW